MRRRWSRKGVRGRKSRTGIPDVCHFQPGWSTDSLSSALSLLASLYCYAELALIQREMLRFVLPAEVGGVSAPTYWFVCGNSRSMIEGNILHIWRAISHDICIQIHQFGLCILRTIILVCVFSMVLWNVFLYNPSFYCGFLNAASTVCCHRNQIKKYLGFKKKTDMFLIWEIITSFFFQ